MSYNQKLYQWYRECEKTIQKHNIETLRRPKVAIAIAASAIVIWANKISKEKRHYKKKRFV